jgi:hypothetical protein
MAATLIVATVVSVAGWRIVVAARSLEQLLATLNRQLTVLAGDHRYATAAAKAA